MITAFQYSRNLTSDRFGPHGIPGYDPVIADRLARHVDDDRDAEQSA